MIYYGVRSRYFYSGKVESSIIQIEADQKPANTEAVLPKYCQYIDYYDTRKKAETPPGKNGWSGRKPIGGQTTARLSMKRDCKWCGTIMTTTEAEQGRRGY